MNTGQTAGGAATGAAPIGRSTFLDVIEVFDTFELTTRSATLDGSIPVRAAQGCKPLLDGNSSGVHLRLRRPAMMERVHDGAGLRLTDEGLAAATADYDRR